MLHQLARRCRDAPRERLGVHPAGSHQQEVLGGTGTDEARNVAIAPDGSLALVGHTNSPTLPGFTGALNGTQDDAFVARVDQENNLLFLRGAVPGPAGGYLVVEKSGR